MITEADAEYGSRATRQSDPAVPSSRGARSHRRAADHVSLRTRCCACWSGRSARRTTEVFGTDRTQTAGRRSGEVRSGSGSTGDGVVCRCGRREVDRDGLDGVAAVAESVPLRMFGLGAAGEVGRPGAYGGRSRLVESGEQLPPLPAVAAAVADEASGLPWPVADRHVDGGDGRRTRPCHAADDHVADGYIVVTVRFGDDRPDLLEAYGFSDRGAVALPLVDVALRLEEALERRWWRPRCWSAI